MPFQYGLLLLFLSIPALDTHPPIENPKVLMALETIDPEDIYAYVSYLASDGLFGRNAGTRGNDKAAEWIADFFKKIDQQVDTDKCSTAEYQDVQKVFQQEAVEQLHWAPPLLAEVLLASHRTSRAGRVRKFNGSSMAVRCRK